MNALRVVEAGGTIAYKVAYAKIPGSDPIVAIFLSQVAYWSARSEDGWCWITHDSLEDQTGLSRKQQDRAAATLVTLGVLEKELRGLPAKIHYRVDFEYLTTLVGHLGQPVMSKRDNHLYKEIKEKTTCGGFESSQPEQQPESAGDSPTLKGLVQISEEKSKGGRKRKEVPAPPTQEEITAYMQATWPWLPKIESELCHARHTTSGWVDKNGKPFKDWRGAAKTWATNWKKWNPALYVEALRKLQTERRAETTRDTGAGW